MLLSSLFLLLVWAPVRAQFSLPESYYLNKAKAQLKAAADKKGREAVVVAVKDGCLHYIIRKGIKTDYFRDGRYSYVVRIPFCYEPPFEASRRNPNDFAELLQALYKEKYYLAKLVSAASGLEIYFFEKQW